MNEFDYTEVRGRRRNGWLNTLNGLLTVLVFLLLVIILIALFVPQINKKRETERRVEQLKADKAKQSELLTRRKREEDLLKNDPHYLETIARDRLDLMKEGETIIRIEPSGAPKP